MASAFIRLSLLLLALAGGAFAGSRQAVYSSVLDFLNASKDHTTLLSLLNSATLTPSLGADFSGHLFAPTNGAFKSATQLLDTLTDNQRGAVLLYHASLEQIGSADFTRGKRINTLLAGASLQLGTVNEGKTRSVRDSISAHSISTTIQCGKATIYVVSEVLVPPLENLPVNPNRFADLGSFINAARQAGNVGTGLDLLLSAGLIQLAAEAGFTGTVVLPTNQAFTAAGPTLEDVSEDFIPQILTYHVTRTVLRPSVFAKRAKRFSLNGLEMTSGRDETADYIESAAGKARISTRYQIGDDVVVLVVDRVMLPRKLGGFNSLVERATQSRSISRIIDLTSQRASNLLAELGEDFVGTCFFPLNSIVETSSVQSLINAQSPEQLQNLLMFHCTPDKVIRFDDFRAGNQFQSALEVLKGKGGNLRLTQMSKSRSKFVNGIKVKGSPKFAGYAAFYELDGILLPPEDGSIPSVALQPLFRPLVSSILEVISDLPDVSNALNSTESPFMGTCFLPNNAAVANSAARLQAMSEEELVALLLYHCTVERIVTLDAFGSSRNEVDSLMETVGEVGGKLRLLKSGKDSNVVYRVSGQGGTASIARLVPWAVDKFMVEAGPYANFYIIDSVLFPPSEEVESIASVVGKTSSLSKIARVVSSSPIYEPLLAIIGDNDFEGTCFLPVDSSLTDQFLAMWETHTAEKKLGYLFYHCVPATAKGPLTDQNFNGTTFTSLLEITTGLGGSLSLTKAGSKLFVNGLEVVSGPVPAGKATIFTIQGVLLPPDSETESLLSEVPEQPNLTKIAGYIAQFPELMGLLTNDFVGTCFLPTNIAVSAVEQGLAQGQMGLDPQAVLGTLLYHCTADKVVGPTDFPGSYTSGLELLTGLGGDLKLISFNGRRGILNAVNGGTAWVVQGPWVAGKANFYAIDNVLAPPVNETLSIASEAPKVPNLSSVVQILTDYDDLVERLGNDFMGSCFLPNNTAVAAASTILSNLDDGQIRAVLLYHCTSARVVTPANWPGQVTSEMQKELRIGGALSLSSSGPERRVNGNAVISGPVTAGKANFYVISGLLQPPQLPPKAGSEPTGSEPL